MTQSVYYINYKCIGIFSGTVLKRNLELDETTICKVGMCVDEADTIIESNFIWSSVDKFIAPITNGATN